MNKKQAEQICCTIGEFVKNGKATFKMLAMFYALNDMLSAGEIDE
jgi:hypothetical protein